MKRRFAVHGTDGSVRVVEFAGRQEWALSQLLAAGAGGCTPIEHPGPRWSDYVFKLRGRGVEVETIDERHNGPYAGTHARYVLRTKVEALGDATAPKPEDLERRRDTGQQHTAGTVPETSRSDTTPQETAHG